MSEIIALINRERTTAGLQTLTVNSQMAAFAQSHAEDMAFNNFLSHDASDGSFGEILAIGTPQNAMDQWRQDEHRDYVLGSFTQIGAGYAHNSCSDYGGYITVDLGE